ncbi:MAG: S1 RNA-binding domain-containing protein [Anaerolineales bacterium]|nr:S1 RNA-binding domain-containing protein [Anaerolineales bacterium]
MNRESELRRDIQEAPLGEDYWQALLQAGEKSTGNVPPVEGEEIWLGLGLEPGMGQDGGESHEGWVPGTSDPRQDDEAQIERGWQLVQECFERDEILELEIMAYNRGGLLVQLDGLRGFIPASQLIDSPNHLEYEERDTELARRVGNEICLKIIDLDRDRNRLILSERAAISSEERGNRLLAELCKGEIRLGRVTNLCSFGAFVDLGGAEGLIHISEMSWGRVGHPSDILECGTQVEVYVLNVDREAKKIGLSLRRLQPDPWASVEERYQVGQLVEGTITNVVSFGAFTCVEEGLEGLIHISELAEGNFLHPRNVVNEGDVVTALVLNIDSDKHRLGLSLRQVGKEQEVSPPTPNTQYPIPDIQCPTSSF